MRFMKDISDIIAIYMVLYLEEWYKFVIIETAFIEGSLHHSWSRANLWKYHLIVYVNINEEQYEMKDKSIVMCTTITNITKPKYSMIQSQ